VVANFWTGGSARLVVDLIENLGYCYEQEIVTRDVPPTPAYTGVQITVCKEIDGTKEILSELHRFKPDLLHIHYLGHHRDVWGKEDWAWYDNVFSAAKEYGCNVVENINIPTDPYDSATVSHYVYVSEYVKKQHSLPHHCNHVIYPGSDFSLFTRSNLTDIPDDCIGMIYRLERDKINEHSIDVFIEVVKRRKGTKALIVGGGNLLEHYRRAVAAAGLSESFTFTGYVAYEDLPDYYKKISLFVAPVHRESFGQVTPFAMNMGIAVAGYDVGALPEIIGDHSLLAPPGDSIKLANIIIDLLDNREVRLQLGAQNHLRAKRLFSVEAMIDRYKEIYAQMLESQ
jgi:glycosyltransferase involved in cell wall biosynthesis